MGKGNKTDPYKRRMYRGVSLDNRTISALEYAEQRYIAVAPKKRKPFILAQGSYNGGGVTASAGTHDGGGAIDIGAYTLTDKQRRAVVRWLRRAGWAAWYRPPSNAWGPHIHAILRGHRNASPGAKAQVVAYDNHRDGLAGNAYDWTWRPKRPRRWSHKQNKPIVGK